MTHQEKIEKVRATVISLSQDLLDTEGCRYTPHRCEDYTPTTGGGCYICASKRSAEESLALLDELASDLHGPSSGLMGSHGVSAVDKKGGDANCNQDKHGFVSSEERKSSAGLNKDSGGKTQPESSDEAPGGGGKPGVSSSEERCVNHRYYNGCELELGHEGPHQAGDMCWNDDGLWRDDGSNSKPTQPPVQQDSASGQLESLESRVENWVKTRIGQSHMNSRERAMRLLEEAVELAQSEGIGAEMVSKQVEHVFSRSKGEPHQEAGGVAVCLLGWCASHGTTFNEVARRELSRIEAKPVEEIRGSVVRKADQDLVTCEDSARTVETECKARTALSRLVRRLDEVHAHPHYQGVWQLYMIHGGDYEDGPKYDKELEAAREALAEPCPCGELRSAVAMWQEAHDFMNRKAAEAIVESDRLKAELAASNIELNKARGLAERRQRYITECQQLLGTHDSVQGGIEGLLQRLERSDDIARATAVRRGAERDDLRSRLAARTSEASELTRMLGDERRISDKMQVECNRLAGEVARLEAAIDAARNENKKHYL